MFPFSDEELYEPVEKSIQKVRPMLLTDGGDITVLGIRDAKVYVRLEGACQGCSSAHLTLKNGIERQLRMDIHPDLQVIEVPKNQDLESILKS
ncbi:MULTISPECIES: NifU family protein [unclassified Helicobacter]|uniref:NifU family protein n=1 Tax=unclassified Helicobacter TaxID=2593540 RepID=UPI000CF0F788|nr:MULTISPECIES: NifU family protein [unclassified Helicobacter]